MTQLFSTASIGAVWCAAVSLLLQGTAVAAETEESLVEKYGVLEEVITTARKREEPLQDTPVASTVLGGERLDLLFHADLKTIAFPAPNVNIAQVSAFSNAISMSIRGISNADIDSTVDPPVALFVDGVYLARPVASSLDMFDVESLEILRGPQGTLFGRNTSAGAIQIRNRRPTGEFGVRSRLTVGEYGRLDFKGAVDFPIIEGVLAGKLGFLSQNMDGYYESSINGSDLGEEEILAFRPMISWTPTDTFDLTLIGEYHKNESEPTPQSNETTSDKVLCALHGFCGAPIDTIDEYEVESVDVGYIDAEIWGITAEMNYDVAAGTFTWISNYRDTDEDVVYDPDAVIYPMFLVDRRQPHEQYSTEFRFASNAYERFDFVAGVFVFHQEYELERYTSLAVIAPPPFTIYSVTGQDHDAFSVFGEINFHVTDALTLTVGGRYTDEEKDFFQEPFGAPNSGESGERTTLKESWDDFGPKFGVQYRITNDVMTYFTYQKGFKSGGMNGRCGTSVTCSRSFDPEKVDGYELGMKAEFFDNRMRANLALFYSEYDDLQRGQIVPLPPGFPNPQETITDNAAAAEMKGFELELTWLALDDLVFNFAVGYLDSEYQDFCADINGSELYDSMPESDCGGSVAQTSNFDDPGGAAAYLVDEDNSQFAIARAPEWNYSINGTYDLLLGNGGSVVTNARYVWTDDLYTDNAERSEREDVGLLDASIGYRSPEGLWSISLFGRNLTDEVYADSRTLVPPLFDTRKVNAPRRWGVELTVEL